LHHTASGIITLCRRPSDAQVGRGLQSVTKIILRCTVNKTSKNGSYMSFLSPVACNILSDAETALIEYSKLLNATIVLLFHDVLTTFIRVP